MERSKLEEQATALGTTNQRARFAVGALPEIEILELARAELFRPLNGFARWAGRDRERIGHDLQHANSCSGARVSFDAETDDMAFDMKAREWGVFKQIYAIVAGIQQHPWLAASGATILLVANWAQCSTCLAEAVRFSAKVTIRWADRDLVREYAL